MTTMRRHGNCHSGGSKLMCSPVSWGLWAALIWAALSLSGCGLEPEEPLQICPGKGSVEEALTTLRANAQKAAAIRANGNCLLTYHEDGKKRKEGPFTLNLRVNPPRHMYIEINVAFDAKGVIAGANEREFWLAIKRKEIDTYWHGQWAEVRRTEGLLFNPRVMLEGLGVADVVDGGEADWSQMNEGPFDILVLRDAAGMPVKKVYVYCCDYVVRKIEYFDTYGQPEVTAELGRYVQITEDFSMPTRITVSYRGDVEETLARFSLSNPKVTSFSEKQRRVLFNPLSPGRIDRYKNRRELVEGEWVDR